MIGNNQSGSNPQRAVLGAIIGAGIGSLMGFGVHKGKLVQEQKAKQDFIFGIDKETPMEPASGDLKAFKLSNPDVEKRCLPWQVIGNNQLVQNHCIWTIKGGPTWKKN